MATKRIQSDWAKTALRLPRNVHEQVHSLARIENRTFNGQLVTLIQEGLAMHNSGNGEKKCPA